MAIAVVVAGTFQYRSSLGRDLLTPGSLLLGNAAQYFECSHDHAAGDRCVAFRYTPDYFEHLAADAGVGRSERTFRAARLPPLPEASALVAQAATGVVGAVGVSWEELAIRVAVTAIRLSAGLTLDFDRTAPGAAASARVTESVRTIERHPGVRWTLRQLAANAGQSPFHYLRTFEQLTGVTPHQFILRSRLREAATRLVTEDAKVIEIALAAGFGDISNFNRSFRVEFGAAPQAYRRQVAPATETRFERRCRSTVLDP